MKLAPSFLALISLLPALTAESGQRLAFDLVTSSSHGGIPLAPPSSPLSYVLVDAGVIEEGRRLGGDPTPDPGRLAATIASTLEQRGLAPAQPGQTPDLLLIFHRGALRNEASSSPSLEHGAPAATLLSTRRSWSARLNLLGERPGAHELRAILAGGNGFRLSPEARSLLRTLQEERYFLVLSAFDYAAITTGQDALRWRGMASCETAPASMTPALEAAAEAVSQRFGTAAGVTRIDHDAPAPPDAAARRSASEALVSVAPAGVGVPPATLRALGQQEVEQTLRRRIVYR